MSAPLGPDACYMHCPSCNSQITTRVQCRSTNKTHIIALILCLFVCWPCAAALYCTKCARNSEHYCPNCNAYLGVYER